MVKAISHPKVHLPKIRLTLVFLLFAFLANHQYSQAGEEQGNSIKPWNELSSDRSYSISQSFQFYRLKAPNGSLATLLVMDLNDRSFVIRPFFNQKNKTVSNVLKDLKAIAGVNGGYFNLSNGESTSYIVINGKNQCDPKQNKALVENPKLKPYLDIIFNRSELRILEDNNKKRKAVIANHSDPITKGYTLIHSLQAGPRLLPKLTDQEEAFTRTSADGKEIDSIGTRKKAARTAVGLTYDNHIMLLCVANKNQDEFSSGVTLEQLAQMLRDLGCDQALNLDGGTSTTMAIAQADSRDESSYVVTKVISGEPEKLVKSGLLIEKNINRLQSRYSTDFFPMK